MEPSPCQAHPPGNLPRLHDRALEESQEAFNLGALQYEIDLTPDARIRFLNAITKLRSRNTLAGLITQQLKGQIAMLGETPTEAELEDARARTPFYSGGLPMKQGSAP